MFDINKFTIQTLTDSSNEGLFRIAPLPKGFGHTLGTVFRRIMLSSIPGAAVTSVKLAGVQHEYTTITGLTDDVLAVVLSMKGIAVISHSVDPVMVKLQVKGDKGGSRVVTAKDIEKNPMIEIINPEYIITTLADEKSSIDAEIIIERGTGYALPNEAIRAEIGTIPLDAIFNPVKLVAVEVKDTRVGQQTDLDSVELKVITNGTVSPAAALYKAAEIFNTMALHFLDMSKEIVSSKAIETVNLGTSQQGEEVTRPNTQSDRRLPIMELELPTRVENALLNAGYVDLMELDGMAEEELGNIKGMGEKSLNDLKDILKNNGVKLI